TKTVTGLTNGRTYTFKVAAVNAVGTGAQSAASKAVTPAGLPGAPGAGAVGRAIGGAGRAAVTWTPSSDGGSAITGYSVTPFIGAVGQPAVASSGPGTSKVISSLANGTAYTFKVAAVNAVGTGAQSAASNVVTPAGVPGAPTVGPAVR